MSFLPEEDQEYLSECGIKYEELTEEMPGSNVRRGVLFPGFSFSGNLRKVEGSSLVGVESCDLLLVVPDGYATTKLDSFYTIPRLKRADGKDPQSANTESALFGKTWQFWSRHVDNQDWRVGIDGLRTFINYIRAELRNA